MKKYLILLAVLLSGATLTSCNPDDDPSQDPDEPIVVTHKLEVNPTKLEFGQNAETKTVTICTDDEWSIELPRYADWFKVSATEGKGQTELKVSVDNINEGTDYDSYIEISTQWETATVFISQHF